MTCNDKCIHYPVCEMKKYDFANIEECEHYKQEPKHGEWAEDISACYPNYPSGFRCSICSHWYTSKTPCCPNCGARMTH